MKITSAYRTASILIAISLLFGGCSRTVVYGESTGLNLGIEADLATDAPAEVNFGFRRRVVGIVPPLQDPNDGRVVGEAATILSRFEIDSVSDPNAVFNTSVAVRGAFASGEAATNLITRNPNTERILRDFAEVETVVARVPNDPAQRSVNEALLGFVSQSPENRERYLEIAQVLELSIPDSPAPTARALGAISNPENSNKNAGIATLLGL